MAGYGLGIDLGTTYTAAASWRDTGARVEPLTGPVVAGESAGLPSVAFVDEHGMVLVGDEAERRAVEHPADAVRGFKRRFGDDVPYLVGDREFTAEDFTRHLLSRVVEQVVVGHGGERPAQAILTVPATWQDYRLECMSRVVDETGLNTDTPVLPEPAAAAVFYAGRDHVQPGSRVGVYDFGGGTFDATVLTKTSGGFEILGLPSGIDDTGGMDVDDVVVRLVAARLGPDWDRVDRADPAHRAVLARLRTDATAAKEALSLRTTVQICVDLPGVRRTVEVRRTDLEAQVAPLVERTVEVMADVIDQVGLVPRDLDRILLVGGSSRMPLVTRLLDVHLGVPIVTDTHPKYAVCLGAAIAAGSLLDATATPTVMPGPTRVLAPGTLPQSDGSGAVSGEPEPLEDHGTTISLNLATQGLTEAFRVPVRPAAELRRWRPTTPENEQLTADLGADTAYANAAHWAVLLIVGLTLVLGVLFVILLRR